MRIERAVIAADAGMVAPDHQVRAAEILPEQGVQQGFAGPAITHFYWIAGLDDRSLDEIIFDQYVDGLDPHFGRNVARL